MKGLHPVHVHLNGPKPQVMIGGVDISRALAGLYLRTDPESLPEVELDLCFWQGEVNGEAIVEIPEAAREALVALGWTPPT